MQYVPDDLLRVVAIFSESDLLGMLRLRLVNRQFNRAMRHPSVVSHVLFTFIFHHPYTPSVQVKGDRYCLMPENGLGSLTTGVRHATIHDVTFGSDACVQRWFKTWCNLRTLKLYHSIVRELDLPSKLETLSLNWCWLLNPLPHAACEILKASFCDTFDYGCIAGMTGLKGLKLEQISVRDLDFVTPLAALHSLSLSECAQLTDISALAGLHGLEKLKLEYCPLLADIGSISSLTRLTVLKLLECHHIANADLQRVLDQLSSVNELSIRHHRITVLNLSKLPSLTCVRLYDCVDLADLRGLPAGLLELNLECCFRLRDFEVLMGLMDLRYLNLCDCRIAQLPKLPSLRELNVSHCDNLTDQGLTNVFPCPELRCLIMHDCEQVTTESRTFTSLVPSVVC